ncbi:MAG: IS605 OrfB family transposase [Parcubacteria group bacterium Gr01-1014_18]|nr:MAG: IS605 OrfB family transposase [Parcubacteria group bacterium Gr01-1014_18]TSC98082.1 MAG: IS605 OrfB family transposase [Parcubacteria group bacterium Greene1014_20]TSD06517.1 MAG: IS605 OrfB family transposase [Parcubacteria group bacterium Greene0714_2]
MEKTYRTVRFPISPSPDEISLFKRVSDNLSTVWNDAWKRRHDEFEQFIKPLYDECAKAKAEARNRGFVRLWDPENKKKSVENLKKMGFPEDLVAEQNKLLAGLKEAYKTHKMPTLFDHINALTQKRNDNAEYGLVPRNWQEETLDSLDGSFKSFCALRKAGDFDAKPPKQREVGNFFYKIPGRVGFKLSSGRIQIRFGSLERILEFDIPEYQREKLVESLKCKKFEIYREFRDLSLDARFWISITYEIPIPDERPAHEAQFVFVALGASSMGIVSPKGDFVVPLPRPDYHWKGEDRIPAVDQRIKNCVKGSRKWQRRISARALMFAKLGAQNKQGQYITVSKLLQYGTHFVVTRLPIRSKAGSLADSTQSERGGAPIGPNWAAQNTGNLARLVDILTEKAKEKGGRVIEESAPSFSEEELLAAKEDKKIFLAKKLREKFLQKKG